MREVNESSRESPSRPTYRRRVAIIGAGFGGLALANLFEKQGAKSDDACDYQVFEAKTAPIPICGPIRLPHGRQVLSELGLKLEEQRSQIESEDDAMIVEQEEFLKLLRSKVGEKIRYSCEIDRVERRPDNQYFLYIKDKQEAPVGPFHLVVAADGLFGLTSTRQNKDVPLVIGDARWQRDMWFWDFGRRRRHEGADIAICDALELGKRIATKDLELDRKFSPSLPPSIPIALRGKLGLFGIPILLGIILQLILQLVEGKAPLFGFK